MRILTALLLIGVPALANCHAVPGERIRMRDLAAVVPSFGNIEPERAIGFAPLPGSQRIFTAGQIESLAKRSGVSLPPGQAHDVCFTRESQVIAPSQLRDAMEQALGIPGVEIAVTDYGRYALPPGRLQFSRSALASPPAGLPDAEVIWRGKLIDDFGKSWTIWAKVRVLVEIPVIVATENLAQGEIIDAARVVLVRRKQFPRSQIQILAEPEQVVGKTLKRKISAGQPLSGAMLEEPKAIQAGDTVHVTAISGTAEISFDSRAESGGRKGDRIVVRNPSNGFGIPAVIVDKGKARVVTGPGPRKNSGA